MEVWQWTLTKDAVAPCFVRDVLDMRPSSDADVDFFWLGYTPCRTVLLVAMVVAVQVYDKRAIYTIDDGTGVVDCVLRHSHAALPAPHTPPRSTTGLNAKSNAQRPSPKKQRLDKAKALKPTEPPPPITEPGYPVRVVGKVVRHYQSKQIHADSIELCPSSLDEIAHLERVIQLHKTKYSLAVPFVPPPKPTSRAPPPHASTSHAETRADAGVFSAPSGAGPSTALYTLPVPPQVPMPPQNRSRPPAIPIHDNAPYHGHSHIPSSPTASSIVSSAPSSPCKSSSPVKSCVAPSKPKLRHPSRLHTRDLTANTFRLYVKHYMDNAPSPFSVSSWSSPSQSTCGDVATPTKGARFGGGEREGDGDATPRPRPRINAGGNDECEDEEPTLGFTLSHLRRVPELALLAARVVRTETRKRDKAERDKAKAQDAQRTSTTSVSVATSSKSNGRAATTDPPRKKMKRLFAWAVVKLYEEGSIVLWDGEVRPLPVPPPPETSVSGMRHEDTLGSVNPCRSVSASVCGSALVLYNSSASASLYSHYHPPRRRDGEGGVSASAYISGIDGDADPGEVSDPGADEEAYMPLDPQFLARYVKEAADVVRKRQRRDGNRRGRAEAEVMAEEVLTYMQRMDVRWARVGAWAVEEALGVLKAR